MKSSLPQSIKDREGSIEAIEFMFSFENLEKKSTGKSQQVVKAACTLMTLQRAASLLL